MLPPPFTRQHLTEEMLARRTPEAHAAVLADFRKYKSGMYDPPVLEGNIIFPGVDGGGEWEGRHSIQPALLYVNSNEMPWLQRLVPRSDKSLYGSALRSCHGDDLRVARCPIARWRVGAANARGAGTDDRPGERKDARIRGVAGQQRRQCACGLPDHRERRG
jgi:quinoprotein glucose dehydrogenase